MHDVREDRNYLTIRMFHQTTVCQGHYTTGKNFVTHIKTISPVVKAVKLMDWRQAALPPDLVDQCCLPKFPNN